MDGRLILRLIWGDDWSFNLQTADIGARLSAAQVSANAASHLSGGGCANLSGDWFPNNSGLNKEVFLLRNMNRRGFRCRNHWFVRREQKKARRFQKETSGKSRLKQMHACARHTETASGGYPDSWGCQAQKRMDLSALRYFMPADCKDGSGKWNRSVTESGTALSSARVKYFWQVCSIYSTLFRR
jgi:hypothetical protein